MEFGILGPLEVREGGHELTPRRAQQRVLLAMLLVHANEVVSNDRLIDALWGDSPPATASTALHGHVSALRKQLGATRIETVQPGYRLPVEPDEVDLARFEKLFAQARGMVDAGKRAKLLREALALWRGEPLADLRDVTFAESAIARLDALRLAALEERAAADLALGRHAEILPELEQLVGQHPLSEGLRAQLMLALYRSGRQAEALRVYHEGRRRLAEELGIEPGSALQTLERQILGQDPNLSAPVSTPSAPRQERKRVTVLVAEVVSATPADPEDLERVAGLVLERLCLVVERFGGTAERLFANALLGVFGAPRAHDDDAQRAVRAALESRDTAADPRLQLRIGIESGEALVTIDGAGVAITGDVLTVASHLQATAPAGVVVVGKATYQATDTTITYKEAAHDSWWAEAVRAANAAPGAAATPEAPFIGRDDELTMLEHTLARARKERSVQLATITAEPGGGKTRLVREFRALVDAKAEPCAWRQGRCLPYGEGVTYWALGEIVKAEAAILESDDSDVSGRKLALAVAALEPDAVRRAWLERSLAALIGIEGASAPGDRQQAFAVWRQFLEAIAAREPLILVIEDIHWADHALLEFIDHLVSHASGVPIVVLCTARLELLEAHPDWAGGKRNAATLALAPLSEPETEQLLRALLGRPAGQMTIKRAGGNPLFARELALIVGRLGSEDTIAIPDTLHAVISARLDAIPPELKSLAGDAAVVGEVFWSGALASMAGLDEPEVEERLSRLVANDVVRRHRFSSVASQTEYSFLHVLVRDVAYGQIPRRDRVSKHRSAAEWIEGLAGDRLTDHAELVAHHYVQGLELAARLGDDEQARDLEPRARRFLMLAGERLQTLDSAQAETLFRRALEMTPDGDPTRGRLLSRLGDVAQYTGRLPEAERLCEAAIAELQAYGDPLGAGEAMVTLALARWRLGRPEGQRRQLVAEAIRTLEQLPPGSELVQAYSRMATEEMHAGWVEACREWSLKALALADQLGMDSLKSRPLQFLGQARFELGDPSGLDDMQAALQIGLDTGLSWETGTAYANLAEPVWLMDGPAAGLELKRTAADFSLSRGLIYYDKYIRAEMLWLLFDLGRWDELVAGADELLDWDREHGRSQVTMISLTMKARVLLCRGRTAEASALEAGYLPRAQEIGDPQALVPALATAAAVRQASGDAQGAADLIAELEEGTRHRVVFRRVQELPIAARIGAAGGSTATARALLPPGGDLFFARGRHSVMAARAILAEASGDIEAARELYAGAAEGWQRFGCPGERAYALLGEGRCLVSLGRAHEARTIVHEARHVAAGLNALPLVAEAELLIK
jgi:DNA-binding SARP family transcriptional activator